MSDVRSVSRISNPFSTRFVRPGEIAYLFEPGTSVEQLVARFAAFGWRGQIVGPHGSGKSTLLASLAESLAHAGRPLYSVALRDGARRMPADWFRQARSAGAKVIAIDGYEQLGFAGRLAARFQCRRHGWGLLFTSHRELGLPTLYATSSRLEVAQAIAAQLQSGHDSRLGAEVVVECFAAAGGNVRETLFRLYDRWEMCSRGW